MPGTENTRACRRLGLGSAQFGLDYGVSNASGLVGARDVTRILARARERGVGFVDTAAAYGRSEEVLGATGLEGFRVVTKLAAGTTGPDVHESVSGSLRRLRLRSVHGLLVHDAADITGPGGSELVRALEREREAGRVEHIGVSVYSSEQVAAVLGRFLPDLVQLPVNVLDQRLVLDGTLARLHERGVRIHARSVFLQGLLLMAREDVPAYFGPWFDKLEAFRTMAADQGLTTIAAALGFVLGLEAVDAAIVGVTSVAELDDVCASATPLDPGQATALALDDPELVDPSRWRLS